MKHYICTGGCHTTSKDDGHMCEVANCPHNGKKLEGCECTDDKHFGRAEKKDEKSSEAKHEVSK